MMVGDQDWFVLLMWKHPQLFKVKTPDNNNKKIMLKSNNESNEPISRLTSAVYKLKAGSLI